MKEKSFKDPASLPGSGSGGHYPSDNTDFPQLYQYACGCDAAETPGRYTKPYALTAPPCADYLAKIFWLRGDIYG